MHYFLRFWIFFCCCTSLSFAQSIKKEDYFKFDSYAQKAGSMKGCSLSLIVDSISQQCKDELQIIRTFYCWQATFIDFDNRRFRHPGNRADNASTALMERKASSEGFAAMFKAMCDQKNIACQIVKGVLRNQVDDIGKFHAERTHYWNIVSIQHTNYLVDVSLAAGPIGKKGRSSRIDYTDAWWLCNRKLFAYSHFPKDPEAQLLQVPISRLEFTRAPIVGIGAIVSGLVPSAAIPGVLRGIAGEHTKLKFGMAGHLNVTQVKVVFDHKVSVPVAFDLDEFGFYLFLPHGNEGVHIAELYVNNSLAFTFSTKMRPALKNRKDTPR